jgi:histidine phosphotransferase ChpT
MSEAHITPAEDPSIPTAPQAALAPEELAAKVAARLCHDFLSPASGIMSGLDLLEDPSAKDMRDEAMDLIASSARKLVDSLTFARVAFGAYASAEAFDSRELETLSQGVFAHVRPTLEWAVEAPTLPKAAARALLNLVQIAAGALATGGVATVTAKVENGWVAVLIDAAGPRVRMHPDVVAGLKGEPLGEGLAGRWVQAYYLHALVTAAGGMVAAEVGEERVLFKVAVTACK